MTSEELRLHQEIRKRDGREIARKRRIKSDGDDWKVNGSKRNLVYTVNIENQTCTCPDFRTHDWKCKHIWAVEFSTQRNTRKDSKETNAASDIALTRKTYPRDWGKYNMAKYSEKDYVPELLYQLCKTITEPEQKPTRGRPRLPLRDLVFAIVYKVYINGAGRTFTADLNRVRKEGFVSKNMHFNTVLNGFGQAGMTALLQELITISSVPLVNIESRFAVDSTCFTSSRYTSWFSVKYQHEVDVHDWTKLHLVCGVITNIVTAVVVTDKIQSDFKQLPQMIAKTKQHFKNMQEVLADSAYLGDENIEAIVNANAKAYIDFKSNSTGQGSSDSSDAYKKLYYHFMADQEEYMKHYHQRSNVESTFSAIKRIFSGPLMNRGEVAQTNEILCQVLAYNLTILNTAMHVRGVIPSFLGSLEVAAGPVKTETKNGRKVWFPRQRGLTLKGYKPMAAQ